eukprot:5379586-Prymnesium_polylepis.1
MHVDYGTIRHEDGRTLVVLQLRACTLYDKRQIPTFGLSSHRLSSNYLDFAPEFGLSSCAKGKMSMLGTSSLMTDSTC